MTAIPKLVIVSPGKKVMLTVPHYWALGDTIAEAKKKLQSLGGKVNGSWRIYSVHPDTYIDEMGYINAPVDNEPMMLAEYDPE